jgi:hypothetical protein
VTDGPPRAAPPFGHLRPVATAVAVALGVALVWVVAGAGLPGGRWFAVHVFTIGVVTNAIVGFAYHFSRTVLHAPGRGGVSGRFVTLNVGAVALLVGLPQGARWAVAVGATLLMAAVFWLYLDLRRMRRAALAPRFAFVVRAYERASAAFIHGAVLGLLMGVVTLGGAWYGALRIAHLHVNILGWAGLTLLATLAFFGPTVLRTRMVDGADQRAAGALRYGATGLTVAVVALLLLGHDTTASAGRAVATVGLVVYAVAASAICGDVIRAARRARPSVHGRFLVAACVWFPIAVWADVVAVGTDSPQLVNAVGLAVLGGVLAQSIVAALGYFAPMMWAPDPGLRRVVRDRHEAFGRARALALNAGVVLVIVAALVGTSLGATGAVMIRAGWVLVLLALLGTVGLVLGSHRGVPRGT